MLNIFKGKLKNINNKPSNNNLINVSFINRPYPPFNQEWNNSVYSFNQNNIKNLNNDDKNIINLIKNHFNSYSKNLRKILIKRKRSIHFRRIRFLNKILLSKPEIKHTNDKVIINLYIYDRNNLLIMHKLSRLSRYVKNIKVNLVSSMIKFMKHRNVPKIYLDKTRKNLLNLNKIYNIARQVTLNKFFVRKFNLFLTQKLRKTVKLNKEVKLYPNIFGYNKNLLNNYKKSLLSTNNNLLNKLTIPSFWRYMNSKALFCLSIKKIVLLNKNKYNNIGILHLRELIHNMYNKKVIFNFTILKKPHLNVSILNQVLAIKIARRKFNARKVINKVFKGIIMPFQQVSQYLNLDKRYKYIQNYYLNNFLYERPDEMSNYIQKHLEKKIIPNVSEKEIIHKLNNKTISGIKLVMTGRISKRITAARSMKLSRQKGTIRNIYSSYSRLSSAMIRNNLNSNIQFNKSEGKRRIGSFGIKGWINSV